MVTTEGRIVTLLVLPVVTCIPAVIKLHVDLSRFTTVEWAILNSVKATEDERIRYAPAAKMVNVLSGTT